MVSVQGLGLFQFGADEFGDEIHQTVIEQGVVGDFDHQQLESSDGPLVEFGIQAAANDGFFGDVEDDFDWNHGQLVHGGDRDHPQASDDFGQHVDIDSSKMGVEVVMLVLKCPPVWVSDIEDLGDLGFIWPVGSDLGWQDGENQVIAPDLVLFLESVDDVPVSQLNSVCYAGDVDQLEDVPIAIAVGQGIDFGSSQRRWKRHETFSLISMNGRFEGIIPYKKHHTGVWWGVRFKPIDYFSAGQMR